MVVIVTTADRETEAQKGVSTWLVHKPVRQRGLAVRPSCPFLCTGSLGPGRREELSHCGQELVDLGPRHLLVSRPAGEAPQGTNREPAQPAGELGESREAPRNRVSSLGGCESTESEGGEGRAVLPGGGRRAALCSVSTPAFLRDSSIVVIRGVSP